MSEDYWDRRRRHLNEDHKFRREQSKRDIKILKTKGNIDRLTGEITRLERSEKLKTLLDEMHKEKTSVLTQISACSAVRKDQWYQHLDNIDLTSPGADEELRSLRKQIEIWRILWRGNDGPQPLHLPDWSAHRPWTGNWLSTRSESTQTRKPSSSLNPVELTPEQEGKAKEVERELKESTLARIVSSLDDLISARNRYESAFSNL